MDLLDGTISKKDMHTTERFVKQLYNPRVKKTLVNDLNPLKQISVLTGEQSGESHYLDFKFSRVYEGEDIESILVSLQDVTQQVRLEQRLEQEKAQNDLQIEMLTTILNVSPQIINGFIINTKNNIIKINEILKTPGSTQVELENKLVKMYRVMHSLKGEASALQLHSFTTIAQNFEDKLKALQQNRNLSGNDFLVLTIHLDELLNLSNTIETLGRRISQNASQLSSNAPELVDIDMPPQAVLGLNAFYEQFADTIATRQEKQATLKASGFDEQLPHSLESTLKEIVIQLIRNAVVHGIEASDVRERLGKPLVGNIQLSLMNLAEPYKITIKDDGAGIDYDAIYQKAIEMGYNQAEIDTWNKQKLTGLLFKSGFSTKQTVDEDAGRGVGMDIIKEHVQSLHGNIAVDSKSGQFTRFTIKIPKNPHAE